MEPSHNGRAACALAEAADPPEARSSTLRWWARQPWEHQIEFGLATVPDAFDGAFRLVHDQYVARGYIAPQASGRRLVIHNILPATKVFVARGEERVVGTVTLIPDSPIGLPMEEIYRREVADLRDRGRRLAEVSSLAIHPAFQPEGLAFLGRLVRLVGVYAVEFQRLDDLCIAVNPRHAGFYKRFFRFEPLGRLKRYAKVNGAPAVALRLDLRRAVALIEMGQTESLPPHDILHFLFSPENYWRVVARLYRELPHSSLPSLPAAGVFADHAAAPSAELSGLAGATAAAG